MTDSGGMNPLDEELAGNVRAELARRRISQLALAPTINMTTKTLGARLRAETSFTVPELLALAAAIDVDPADLLPRRAA